MRSGTPTVTAMPEPESDRRTLGSASESLTRETLLDLRSSTTLGGGRGWDDAAPQLTPMAAARGHPAIPASDATARRRKRRRSGRGMLGGIDGKERGS